MWQAPCAEEMEQGHQGRDLEKRELCSKKVPEICRGSHSNQQLNIYQHQHVRKFPEARARTTKKSKKEQSLELIQDWEQSMFQPARVETL